MPLPNLIVLVIMVLVFAYVLRGPVLGFFASRLGTAAEAVVKSAALTSSMDERKRYYHRLVLEVAPDDGAPFEATVSQVLPWMMAGDPPAGLRVKVRYLRLTKGVHVIGPVGPNGRG